MPVSFMFCVMKLLGTRKFRIGMPSCIASSFPHGLAFISSKPERTITFTSSPPGRRHRAAAATAGGAAPRSRRPLAARARVAAADPDHAPADLRHVPEGDRREPVDADVDVRRRFL